ncbi:MULTISPECIES: M48 family metalloprotease [unclassified Pseudoalteromonas]|uniref:beta-barrel assembly-enhancing protease n=1 Tax=unclassified Pseudoalteromonas TaxID=194690 RepID=UPI0005AA02E7|nr:MULTISPECIES: M48 family metalloprotease [unclassified Pseudoalteromonas]
MNKKKKLSQLVIGAFLLSSPVLAQSSFKLPDLGTSALQVLPLEKEKAIGEIMMMKIKSSSPVIQDPLLDEYLTSIGNRLVAHADDIRFPFEFFWIKNNEINAFAFYGGHVGVHAGLIAKSDNESQFASVLGHEIAHVTQRHLARRLQKQQDNSGLTLAGMVAGILTTIVNPEAGMAIISANQTQNMLSQMTHSRGAEQEADRIGMTILNNSGFDPRASSEFLAKLSAQLRFKQKPPVFLLSHPLPDSRVSDIRLRAQQYPEKFIDSNLDFLLAKSRIKARFTTTSEKAEQLFRNDIKKHQFSDRTAAKYGLALTLIDQKKLDEAQEILTKLLKTDPANLFYLDSKTDLLIAQKNTQAALTLLKEHYQLKPNNQVITLNYANAAIEAKDYPLAERLLRYFLLDKPDHPLGKDLMAQTYKMQKKQSAYHEIRASIMIDYGAYQQASDEIQKALNFIEKTDDIKRQRLKALLKQYRQMQKELAKL